MKKFPLVFLSVSALGALTPAVQAFPEEKGDQIVVVTPAPVKAALARETEGGAILSLERSDESPVMYRATVKMDGTEYVVSVEASGKLHSIELKNTEEEPEPRLENFPAAAKTAVLKYAQGANVEEVCRQKQQTSYSVVVKQDDGKYRITVDEQGKLITKYPADE